ncbi:MAG TPA: AMP-binding protein, partial [Polyangiaceae bacterium]|nr:AMP-binding protein [Polyangiaceae bacterium]
MGKPPPTGRTLSALFIEQTRARPDAVFIAHGLDEESSFTFAEIERRALRIAGALKNVLPKALGTRALSKDEPRPRAALLLPNGPEFVASFFGAILAGCLVLPLDPRLRPGEIRSLLEHGGAAALLTTPSALSPDLRPTCPILDAESLSTEPAQSQEKQSSPNSPNTLEFEDPFDDASEPAVLLGTSGSTSTPKAVLLSHRSLLANARAFCERYRVDETDVLATVLSLCHSFGMTACLLAALLVGASVATADEPLPARVAALCSRRSASIFLAAASFYQYLVRSEACSPAHFARVRHFI